MPALSGVPLPTPVQARDLRGDGQLSFLVSQQIDANTNISDNITGYRTTQDFIWVVNHVFLSAQR